MKPLIWFIHGAAASPLSFNWLKDQLVSHESVDIEYDTDVPLSRTINELRERASSESRPITIIGHSLGGVIGAAIAQSAPVERLVTLSSPFGGSMIAGLTSWFSQNQLLKDISPQSAALVSLKMSPPTIPVLSIVTEIPSSAFLQEKSDGVVTVLSQMALYGPVYERFSLNHFEVLLSPEVASTINNFLTKNKA